MSQTNHVSRPGLQSLCEACSSLRSMGRRSGLALLGIVMGSASIIALLNVGHSGTHEALRAFEGLGTDILVASFPFSAHKQSPLPSFLDVHALQRALPGLSDAAAVSRHSARVSHQGVHADAGLIGSTVDLLRIMGLKLQSGRFISPFDQRAIFAVVGAGVVEDLRLKGRSLRMLDLLQIEGYLFQVIGILAPHAANPLIPVAIDDSIVIPIQSMGRLHPRVEISTVLARARVGSDMSLMAQHLEAVLNKSLGGREVSVQVPRQLLDGIKQQSNTFTWLLAGLGGISLLVGGVGVMNVMLMSVSERRREIGVRMALGARRRDIRQLFLLEAATLSVAGALLGALLGVLAAYLFTCLSDWTFHLSPGSLLIGVGSSLLIGIFAGLYPAISASRLSPVTALRED